jgi:hypothetical protein
MRPGEFELDSPFEFDQMLFEFVETLKLTKDCVPSDRGEFDQIYLSNLLNDDYEDVEFEKPEYRWDYGVLKWLQWMARMPKVPFQGCNISYRSSIDMWASPSENSLHHLSDSMFV